ncbi:hypothetical protein CYLTODRAFT_478618 [Cylindrobasidium torrendii FP15055 ss-10]|uniref:Uncharacterized protein n=1 Tax=Cylindrobasidium torrendii FP15055 ss-10 TaxID=1314674 RepID=A0A0D7AT89_9AGAR|nr:hypothetical protein CYLTODRAFT_478618 [Cylindrobasidium torrendii FP15055 ss-10]
MKSFLGTLDKPSLSLTPQRTLALLRQDPTMGIFLHTLRLHVLPTTRINKDDIRDILALAPTVQHFQLKLNCSYRALRSMGFNVPPSFTQLVTLDCNIPHPQLCKLLMLGMERIQHIKIGLCGHPCSVRCALEDLLLCTFATPTGGKVEGPAYAAAIIAISYTGIDVGDFDAHSAVDRAGHKLELEPPRLKTLTLSTTHFRPEILQPYKNSRGLEHLNIVSDYVPNSDTLFEDLQEWRQVVDTLPSLRSMRVNVGEKSLSYSDSYLWAYATRVADVEVNTWRFSNEGDGCDVVV